MSRDDLGAEMLICDEKMKEIIRTDSSWEARGTLEGTQENSH